MESWRAAGGPDSSRLCRAWPEPAIRWQHPCVVRTHLELYQQTVARLWRQGQTSETVVVQHIIAHDTIDMQILRALQAKDKTQAALIEAVKADVKT